MCGLDQGFNQITALALINTQLLVEKHGILISV